MAEGPELPGIVQIVAVGITKTVSTVAATSNFPVPVTANGTPPRFVRVVADHVCHIKFGSDVAGTSCTANDILLSPNAAPDYFNVRGAGFFSICLDTSSATSAVVNITPIEF